MRLAWFRILEDVGRLYCFVTDEVIINNIRLSYTVLVKIYFVLVNSKSSYDVGRITIVYALAGPLMEFISYCTYLLVL